ncbi:hypothetical protein GH733_012055 [Mirounga leonina]|nr:hypothetical protein GH733_012055 [Mirounga leonina]
MILGRLMCGVDFAGHSGNTFKTKLQMHWSGHLSDLYQAIRITPHSSDSHLFNLPIDTAIREINHTTLTQICTTWDTLPPPPGFSEPVQDAHRNPLRTHKCAPPKKLTEQFFRLPKTSTVAFLFYLARSPSNQFYSKSSSLTLPKPMRSTALSRRFREQRPQNSTLACDTCQRLSHWGRGQSALPLFLSPNSFSLEISKYFLSRKTKKIGKLSTETVSKLESGLHICEFISEEQEEALLSHGELQMRRPQRTTQSLLIMPLSSLSCEYFQLMTAVKSGNKSMLELFGGVRDQLEIYSNKAGGETVLAGFYFDYDNVALEGMGSFSEIWLDLAEKLKGTNVS